MDGKRFNEIKFKREEDFEKVVKNNSKTLFGSQTIYFDVKNKIETKTMGGAIPDGLLFDFREKDNPEFYLVEIELEKHDFDEHIFPQIKKFFSFFKNPKSRDITIGKIFEFIKSNTKLEQEFKKFIGEKEIYKTLKDIIENSQNILLVIDENKPEFDETSETITEWAKLVKIEVLKQYTADNKIIFSLNPNFEDIAEERPTEEGRGYYSESFHFEDAEVNVIQTYNKIKKAMIKLDSEIRTNPQRYYISLRKKRNFAFIKIKKKKMHIVIMLSYRKGKQLIKNHKLTQLNEGVQDFYNGPCFKVTLDNDKNLKEILKAIETAYKLYN